MKNKILIVGGDHHNTLGLIESFAEKHLMVYVIVLTKDSWAYVLKSNNIIKGWVCHNGDDMINIMINQFKDETHKVIVFSTSDETANILDKNTEALSNKFVLPNIINGGNLENVMDKEYMSSLARTKGINVPKTWVIDDGIIPDDIEYPCITKAISSVKGTKSNLRIFREKQELEEFLKTNNRCSIIQIQKYIDKKYEFQFLGCSFDYGKEILIPGRTHIDRPNAIENTYFLSFDKLEPEYYELKNKIIQFIKEVGYQGLFSVEFLRSKDNIDYFTEMNYRNDGNAYCATSSGINLPYIYYLYNTGGDYKKEVEESRVVKVFLMPEVYYFRCLLAKEFGLLEWYKNMRKTTCYTTFFKHDIKPFIYFFLLKFVHLFRRLIKRF